MLCHLKHSNKTNKTPLMLQTGDEVDVNDVKVVTEKRKHNVETEEAVTFWVIASGAGVENEMMMKDE